jgi:hypothetical protein
MSNGTISLLSELNWKTLGQALRASADDAHQMTPRARFAYLFLLDNPELFIEREEWPEGMPAEAPAELIAAYYGAYNGELVQ